MNNSIYDLVKSHCIIFDKNLQNVKLPIWTDKTVDWIFQLDYLQRYPDKFRIDKYGLPWGVFEVWIKDNPNWIPTDYDNVFIKTEIFWTNMAIDYQLVLPWKSPISLINRWYFKVREWKEYVRKWRITVYWKALKLYYMGYISWLRDYIIKYSWDCCRADLCWDFPCEFPNWIIDLNISWTQHNTVYFWEKSSPIFFRKYDKTQDLRREKNCFSWLYPSRYTKECWRLEAQISWKYSRSQTPLDWLGILKRDKSQIQIENKVKRSSYKTWLYSVINTIDWLNMSSEEKLDILISSKNMLDAKIEKMKKDLF